MWAAGVLAAHRCIETHDLVDQVGALGAMGDQEHRPVLRRREHVADECLRGFRSTPGLPLKISTEFIALIAWHTLSS